MEEGEKDDDMCLRRVKRNAQRIRRSMIFLPLFDFGGGSLTEMMNPESDVELARTVMVAEGRWTKSRAVFSGLHWGQSSTDTLLADV